MVKWSICNPQIGWMKICRIWSGVRLRLHLRTENFLLFKVSLILPIPGWLSYVASLGYDLYHVCACACVHACVSTVCVCMHVCLPCVCLCVSTVCVCVCVCVYSWTVFLSFLVFSLPGLAVKWRPLLPYWQ